MLRLLANVLVTATAWHTLGAPLIDTDHSMDRSKIVKKNSVASPVLALDFPDPAIIKTKDAWYSFGTSSRGVNVQMARSTDFKNWTLIQKDALPILPDWVDKKKALVWAPDVIKNDKGEFVLYFSATHLWSPWQHCIGVAKSVTIEGPYTALNSPFICPDPTGKGMNVGPLIPSRGSGGAIDASGFRDTDGTRYVIYKVDGNSLAGGGPCGNGGDTKVPTPLMMVRVEGDGYTPRGPARVLLDRSERDGPLIEAPSLARMRDGTYTLFYSSNCYNSPFYDVSYATATNIWGPYKRNADSMLKTGVSGLTAPGGASVSSDGERMVFHANIPGGRAMFATELGKSGNEYQLTL